MQPILQLQKLEKSFGCSKVIDQICLELKDGEALGILGPNGAGKSTLFSLISGSCTPDSGKIIFNGQNVDKEPPNKRCQLGIARSYQIPHPFSGISVFENLLVGGIFGAGQNESECYDRCVEILRQTELLDKANKKAGTLRLLERKRLELARAMATNPKLLLLDEIAGGLTEYESHSLIDTIKQINENGTSIIWIEHVVHALAAVVNRLFVIDFGKELAQGSVEQVMNDPIVQEIYMGISVA